MKIPRHLVDEVSRGRAVLFLGSGASKGAKNSAGEDIPNGKQLGQMISRRFLGGEHGDLGLQAISELAISESSLHEVQGFIREVFEGFQPAPFHLLVPTFPWRGIATTNYDLVVERSYDRQPRRVRVPVSLISDQDQVDEKLRTNQKGMLLVKLHGCISRITDERVPLILTPDQYITHRKFRNRLFSELSGWGYEYPIVFVGHGMQDPDIRGLLLDFANLGDSRPMFYLISNGISDAENRYWASKRITVLHGTYQEFLETLDREIPAGLRPAQSDISVKHPIEARFTTRRGMSESCVLFLNHDVEYVHPGIPAENILPWNFYRGFSTGWAGIQRGLDVRRHLADEILLDVILRDEADRPTGVELYVVKAEAGAGKSVCLRRIAWDAANDHDRLCLYAKRHGLAYEPLRELSTLTQERLFLFVDDAAENALDIKVLVDRARKDGLLLTIICAERVNEWNMACEKLEGLVTDTYRLEYLSEREIGGLVDLLGKHRCLGHLSGLSRAAQVGAFRRIAGRQLLVALHEATQGKPFEDILVDEFNEIQPKSAQRLYLSVCVLNRLGVPVRAGVISRVHGIPFSEFRDRLFKPLEHVVQAQQDSVTQDFVYLARHQLIAEIVFERILRTQEDRYQECITLISALNLMYSTDRAAFRRLIRGRSILELFPDHQMASELFETALRISPDDPEVFHQRGIYEMNRPSGSYEIAHAYLQKARESLSSFERSNVTHSLAELALKRAEGTANPLQRQRYKAECMKLSRSLLNDGDDGRYAYHTILKLLLFELKEVTESEESSDDDVFRVIKDIETYLEDGLQRYPLDDYLLAAESDFGRVLKDTARAFNALKKAFAANRRSPFIATRLSKAYKEVGDVDGAIKVLETALDVNSGDRRLHYSLARLLIEIRSEDVNKITYHLRRSFTKGDRNYDAQFWYARYAFVSAEGDMVRESKEIFRTLRQAPMPPDTRRRVRAYVEVDGKRQIFQGRIKKVDESYGFIIRDGVSDEIFFHREYVDDKIWANLKGGAFVSFGIGFTFGGPIAVDIDTRPV